jgi:hypothetical protein
MTYGDKQVYQFGAQSVRYVRLQMIYSAFGSFSVREFEIYAAGCPTATSGTFPYIDLYNYMEQASQNWDQWRANSATTYNTICPMWQYQYLDTNLLESCDWISRTNCIVAKAWEVQYATMTSGACCNSNKYCIRCVLGWTGPQCQYNYTVYNHLCGANRGDVTHCSVIFDGASGSNNVAQTNTGCSGLLVLKVDGTCDTGCGSGFYLYWGACYSPCPANTYVNPVPVQNVYSCVECNYVASLCWTCTSATQCTNCLSIHYQDLKTMTCFAACPAYTYVRLIFLTKGRRVDGADHGGARGAQPAPLLPRL